MNNVISGAVVGAAAGASTSGVDPIQTGLAALIGVVAQIAVAWMNSRFQKA